MHSENQQGTFWEISFRMSEYLWHFRFVVKKNGNISRPKILRKLKDSDAYSNYINFKSSCTVRDRVGTLVHYNVGT